MYCFECCDTFRYPLKRLHVFCQHLDTCLNLIPADLVYLLLELSLRHSGYWLLVCYSFEARRAILVLVRRVRSGREDSASTAWHVFVVAIVAKVVSALLASCSIDQIRRVKW